MLSAFDARLLGYNFDGARRLCVATIVPCESGDHRLSPGDALRTIPAFQLVGVTPKQEATPSRSSAVTVAFVSAVISYVVQAVYSISTFEVVSFFDSRAPFSSVRVRGFFFPLLPTSLAGRPILLNHSFDTE